jgi:flagellar protein FliJ
MSRVKRMQPVLRIAELEADKAGRLLSQAQQRVKQEAQKLQQLSEYQDDYRRRLLEAGQQGMTVDRLRLYDGFQGQLDRAIAHQKTVIAACEQEAGLVRLQWQQLDIRFKSLEKMLQRLQRETAQQQARMEQRNHDEYARRGAGKKGWN